MGLFDRSGSCFLGGRDHKIADAAALNLGGALDDRKRVGGDTRLDASGAGLILWHKLNYITFPYLECYTVPRERL